MNSSHIAVLHPYRRAILCACILLTLDGLELVAAGFPIGSSNAIPERCELPIVIVEVQVVQGVAFRAIDDSRMGKTVGVV